MIPFRSPILSALDSLQLGDRVATTGTASVPPLLANWGSGTVDVGADARTGSILSAGSVFLRERATVQGSIETGSTLTRQSGTTVTGSVVERATVQLPAAPAITIAWPTTVKNGFTVESGSSWTRTEGAYGNVTVRSNGTLVLGAGTYFFVSLLLESDAKVVVEPGTTLHVRDGLTLRGQFRNASGAVAQVAVQYRGANPAIAERDFRGSILAPNAQLVLGATHPVAFGGQFLARQIVARPDASFAAELLEWGWIFPVPPEPVVVVGIGGIEGLRVGAGSTLPVGSTLVNWGTLPVEIGPGAIVGGVSSIGPVVLGPGSKIDGDVRTGGTLTKPADATVTGSVFQNTRPSLPDLPGLSTSWPAADLGPIQVAGSDSIRLAPGVYGDVVVRSGGRLELPQGDYRFRSLVVEPGGKIVPQGRVVVDIKDDLQVHGGFQTDTGETAPVVLRYMGTNPVSVDVDFDGWLIAPFAQAIVGNETRPIQVRGQILALDLVVAPNTVIIPASVFGLDLFADTGNGSDPIIKSYSGPATVVVRPMSTSVPTRIVVDGQPPIYLAQGGSARVDAGTGQTWNLVVESLGANGTWAPVVSRRGPSINANGIQIDQLDIAGLAGATAVQIRSLDSVASGESFTVSGRVVWSDGNPFQGFVHVYDKDLRSMQLLGVAQTDSAGSYRVSFASYAYAGLEFKRADLWIAAMLPLPGEDNLLECGRSEVAYNLATPATVDLVLAGEPASPLSEFERLDLLIHPLLGATRITQIEAADEFEFLSKELGVPEQRIRFFVEAHKMVGLVVHPESTPERTWIPVSAMALYGLFRQAMPTTLESLGRKSVPELVGALKNAQAMRVVDLRLIHSDLDALMLDNATILNRQERRRRWGFYSRLFGSLLPQQETEQEKFSSLLETFDRDPAGFWDALAASGLLGNSDASRSAIQQMQLKLAVTQIAGGNSALAEQLRARLPDDATNARLLAGLDLEDLKGALTASGAVSSKDPDESVYAKARHLKATISRAFPRDALYRMLSSQEALDLANIRPLLSINRQLDPTLDLPSDSRLNLDGLTEEQILLAKQDWSQLRRYLRRFPLPVPGATKESRRIATVDFLLARSFFRSPIVDRLQALFGGSDDFQFGASKVDQYLQSVRGVIDGFGEPDATAVRNWIRSFARMYAVAPSVDIALMLLENGYRSAAQIARTSRDRFVRQCELAGLLDVGVAIHRTARKISRIGTQLHGMVRSRTQGLPIRALETGIDNNSDKFDESWAGLFGRPVSSLVPDWRSVLSPGAYMVDLLGYLERLDAPEGTAQPLAALLQRRPDLVHIRLDKESTFSEISHSRLVLEILQAYVVHANSWTPAAWESIDWNTVPALADKALRGEEVRIGQPEDAIRPAVIYPLELPVDPDKHEQALLLGSIEIDPSRLACAFGLHLRDADKDAVACARLGIASSQLQILSEANPDRERLEELWGCTPTQLDKIASSIVAFLKAAEISFIELLQYADTRWSDNAVQVPEHGQAELETLRFTTPLGLDALHAANRFFRLLKALRRIDPATGIHDLDCLLATVSGLPIRASLHRIGAIAQLRKELGLGWLGSSSLCNDLDIHRPMLLNLDGEFAAAASWYETIYKTDDPDFAAPAITLSTKKLSSKSTAVSAILGVSTSGLRDLVEYLGIDPELDASFSLRNLSRLHAANSIRILLGIETSSLLLLRDLVGLAMPSDPESLLAMLDEARTFVDLDLPLQELAFAFGSRSAIAAPSAQAASILASLREAYQEAEADLETLPDPEAKARRTEERTRIVGESLGRTLGMDPALLVHSCDKILKTVQRKTDGTVGLDSTLLCLLDPDRLFTSATTVPEERESEIVASFGGVLDHLRRCGAFIAAADLSKAEIDRMSKIAPDNAPGWNGFDLNHLANPVPQARAWFPTVLGYLRMRPLAVRHDPDGHLELARIWTKDLSLGAMESVLGWTQQDLSTLRDLFQAGAAGTRNQVVARWIAAMDLVQKLRTSASTLADWVRHHPDEASTTRAIRAVVETRFDAANWKTVKSRIQVESLNFRRAHLVKLVLRAPELPSEVDSAERLYQWFLIDVNMDASQNTSRIVQAIAAIQQFVQRCLLDLEHGTETSFANFPGVSPLAFDAKRWAWMKNYRVWEANRQVMLFPENYIEPELRPDKSELFIELESALEEAELTPETVERAFESYLRGLDAISCLKITAHCTDPSTGTLHVFGRTAEIPGIHHHRTRSKEGIWSGWQKLDLDIQSEHVVPVFNNRRLYLYWLEFAEKADQPDEKEELTAKTPTHEAKRPHRHWEISLAWSEYQYGKWSQKTVTSPESGPADQPIRGTTLRTGSTERSPSEFRLVADSSDPATFPLRVLEASHEEKKVAREKVVTETVRHSSGRWFNRKVKYVQVTRIETEMVGTGIFRSHLLENGHWSVLRPGGRLLPHLAPESAYKIDTDQDWVNDFQAWKLHTEFRLSTRSIWSGGRSIAKPIATRELVPVLGKLGKGWILFDPLENDTLVQPPWRPFFFLDEDRSYLVTIRSADDSRQIAQASSSKAVASVLADPSRVDPVTAMQVQQNPDQTDEYRFAYGEYFSTGNSGGLVQQLRSSLLRFEAHYHPATPLLLSTLVARGVDGVLSPETQVWSQGEQAFSSYDPKRIVDPDRPKEEIDFSIDGAYSLYNWEVFFHIPMLIAARLTREKRFAEARRWYHYIFDPTASAVGGVPALERFWKFAPFRENLAASKTRGLVDLFVSGNGSTNSSASRRRFEDQLAYSTEHPFEPHGIARLRLEAYQKTVFMKYVDNLLEWADQLFIAYTRESINEATQLYVLAKELLGPAPERVPLPTPEDIPTFATLSETASQVGEAMDAMEDWLTDNPMEVVDGDTSEGSDSDAAVLAEPGSHEFFAIPDNEQLAGFWSRVDDRLFKIRHGLDIDGNSRPLALFSPRLDPSDLVGGGNEAGSVGSSADKAASLSRIPHYRFSSLLPKALEFANEVKSFGSALLSALEKKDAEQLGRIRANHESAMHEMTRKVRLNQIEEAELALEGLRKQKSSAQYRRDYYANLERVIDLESDQIAGMDAAHALQLKAQYINTVASALAAIPTIQAGASGFGGSPHIVTEAGGKALMAGSQAIGNALGFAASIQTHRSTKSGILAGWQRRAQEWDHQVKLADKELDQLESQIAAAQTRIRIARSELASLEQQIRNSKEIEAFLRTKFTNQELYGWMAGRLSTLYLRSYQMAYQMALQVESCFRFERRQAPSAGISSNAWDGLRKGALAGETLAMDLRRLEWEYMDKNHRDPEFTKTISVVALDPAALVRLKATGSCEIELPALLLDADHPGYYHRMVKSVSVTIPCVTGPYSGVNGRLEYVSGYVRKSATTDDLGSNDREPRVGMSVPLSLGQNDTGLFETNLRDERFLPFEGCGIDQSKWKLTLRKECNTFDVNSVSDVVLRIQYTAVWGGESFETGMLGKLRGAGAPHSQGFRVFSLRHEFADSWHAWTRTADGRISIAPGKDRFPFHLRGSNIGITSLEVVLVPLADSTVSIEEIEIGNTSQNAEATDYKPWLHAKKTFNEGQELPVGSDLGIKLLLSKRSSLEDILVVVKYRLTA